MAGLVIGSMGTTGIVIRYNWWRIKTAVRKFMGWDRPTCHHHH
jgi:hypothetical protein